jgi:hypothetical protein
VNDFGSQIQKESDGRSATLKGNVGNGPTLHITSTRGSISVRKEGAAASEAPEAPAGKIPKPEKQKVLKEAEIKL